MDTYDKDQADLYIAAHHQIEERGLRDFLDWLCALNKVVPPSGVRLCVRNAFGQWQPIEIELENYGERIFAEYFEIDMDAVERHRRKILDEIAQKAQT